MTKTLKRRARSIAVLSLTIALVLLTLAVPVSADDDIDEYRYWGQGTANGWNNGTSYRGWCLAIAFNKILIQSGAYDNTFTPDKFDAAMRASTGGRGVSANGWCNFSDGEVAGIADGYLSAVGKVRPDADYCSQIMDYVRTGHAVIVEVPGHFFAIDSEMSLVYNRPYVMDSLTFSSHELRYQYSVVPLENEYYIEQGYRPLELRVFEREMIPYDPVARLLFVNTGADNVEDHTAVIRTEFRAAQAPTEIGFTLGMSPDKRTEYFETLPLNIEITDFFFALRDVLGYDLRADTDYFYTMFTVINGHRYETEVLSFHTTRSYTDDGRPIGWHRIDGHMKFFIDGEYVTGKQTIDGDVYLFNGRGELQYGWHMLGGKSYYFHPETGARLTGIQTIGNTTYLLSARGKQVGWHRLGGNDYYFDPDFGGGMITGKRKVGNTIYFFNQSGFKDYGWKLLGGRKYYFDPNYGGGMVTGLRRVGRGRYYFDPATGYALTEQTITVGGRTYWANKAGILIEP